MNAMINKLGTREFRMIVAGILLLVVAGTVSYVAVPQWKRLSAARERLSALETLPASGDVSIQLNGMREIVQSLKRNVHGEAGALPARELESYLIGKLQSISWSNDVELAGVKPGQRQKVSGFWETTFKVDVTGDYRAIFLWLSQMGTELGYVVIKEFQLTPRGGDPAEPMLQASMTIASYQSD